MSLINEYRATEEAIKGNSEKDFLIWQNTATPPTEFPDEADDLRRRRVRWQAQANPQ
ncbi:hypothetical protein GHU47_30475, partial [Pseudomonas aeruginosa]|nr:hypothetical protein [Pseudomonas aeruginosa]